MNYSFFKLMRLDKPIGLWLFLWPTLWALWLAANGIPPFKILLIFGLGVLTMRSAGCVINDFFDQVFDRQVQRTKMRPLAVGETTSHAAVGLFLVLSMLAAYLAFQLNPLTQIIACVIFLLTIIYPLTKRWTYVPQIFLGATVAGAVLMAFAAIQNDLPASAWLIYGAACLWPVVYDTLYALVDCQDDKKIGVKSTALLMGENFRIAIGLLQGLLVVLFFFMGKVFLLRWPYYASISITILLFLRQQFLIKNALPEKCFKAFLESHWVGLVIFLGIVISKGISA